MNAGISGEHPGKVCLIEISETSEPRVVAAFAPDDALVLAQWLKLLAKCVGQEVRDET